jgi:hypothetical protein
LCCSEIEVVEDFAQHRSDNIKFEEERQQRSELEISKFRSEPKFIYMPFREGGFLS